MANYMGFTTDNINIFIFVIDASGSMEDNEDEVERGLKKFSKSFEKFPEANSIAVSICQFNEGVSLGDFKNVKEVNLKYYTNGGTWLNYAIVKTAGYLKDYISQVVEKTEVTPTVTYLVFSDGKPEGDPLREKDGREAIESLNYMGVTTAFVAFGNAMEAQYGKNMGFVATVDVDDIENFLGVELSSSCKEQSKRNEALGSDFFSQINNNSESANYSTETAQAFSDDWFNNL